MSVSVVICAAGKGARAGFSENKLFAPVGGITVLERTLVALTLPKVTQTIVAYSKEDEEKIFALQKKYGFLPVLGGETRTQSVYNALQAVTGEIVLIHDGARPFVDAATVLGCIESVKKSGSGICALPSTDTVAIANEKGEVQSFPARERCYRIQTPQGFFTQEIRAAYEQAINLGESFTDDSSVFARFVRPPCLCVGARDNIKLTYPEDFFVRADRVGFGVDTHAFGKEQEYIVLCGEKIPAKSGLIAHSDGDVAVHAVMDALLSAAGLRDIGYYFPDTDEKWKGASSIEMLKQVVALIEKEGLRTKSLSVAIQAEIPRLSPYIETMKNHLADVLSLSPTAIGVTAGTNEKLGYVGEGKGITVYAYALLERS
ncbi:MAG: 2-C-methyl-D-erythritol 2,4-cyclodiphosphate synthase [Clostridia bacterium]|nr:2-C-methyl-D-erythritol 2,4-cyclodiphosphate synthase [Clostridia bacterium]